MNKIEFKKISVWQRFDGHKQSGIGYVEYLVVTMIVIFILFAPLPGQGGDAVFDLVLEAIRSFGINSSLLLSLP